MSAIFIVPGLLADELSTGSSQECLTVQAEGDLDIETLPEFRSVLSAALIDGQATVVVDLRRARFLSLRAAAVLAEAVDNAARAGVDFRVLAARREIERVLEVSGVRAKLSGRTAVIRIR